ncbi:MAG TPA: hypothetical protein VMW17_16770 [Candidatus Binatia bacterium]|nr:hypothetical protein [Candidatus Binatia bacterium]
MDVATRGRCVAGVALLIAATLAGCTRKHAPLSGGLGDNSKDGNLLGGVMIPLVVRSVDISAAGEQRGVFFKLSRVPTGVMSSTDSNPARVLIEVDGPSTGEDLPVETYPGADQLVTQIEMSRTNGRLHLVLELSTDEPPPHHVTQMADYVVVSFGTR